MWLSAALLVLVIAHAFLATHLWPWLWPGRRLIQPERAGDASVLFLGAATVAALTGGFAGVVIVFGLSTTSDRFRKMRILGGERLQANWTSVVALSMLSAGLSVAAAFMRLIDTRGWIWTFELAVLFITHASARLVYLLRRLSSVVMADDEAEQEKADQVSIEDVLRHRPRWSA